MTARPASGTTLLFLGSEGVLFSEPRQEVHRFNTMAAVIWCHLEDGLAPGAIAAKLAAAQSIDETSARHFVAAALTDWQAKGLLEGTPPAEATRRAPKPVATPLQDADLLPVGRYRLLDSVIGVRCNRPEQRTVIAPILEHLRAEDPPRHFVDITTADGVIVVYRDGIETARCDSLDALAPAVKHTVWCAALEDGGFLIEIHAGVVAGPSGCVLLPAVPGSGKSTLTAALVHAGFTYFSDEVAVLRHGDLAVRPFPVAICVKEAGIAAVARMFPGVANLPLHNRIDGKRVAYLPPPRHTLPPAGAARPARALVFPHYQPGAPTLWQDLSPAEALERLLAQCVYVPGRLTLAHIKALVAWVARVPAADLAYVDLTGAVRLIAPLLGRAAA